MTNTIRRNNFQISCFLIDDDIDDQEIFSMALQEIDETIHCTFADNGVTALKQLSNDSTFLPNYIFLDINMPQMNGVECLEEIKKDQRLKQIPVFMFSTSADPYIVNKTKELGARAFIVKPPSITELSNVLEKIFRADESPSI